MVFAFLGLQLVLLPRSGGRGPQRSQELVYEGIRGTSGDSAAERNGRHGLSADREGDLLSQGISRFGQVATPEPADERGRPEDLREDLSGDLSSPAVSRLGQVATPEPGAATPEPADERGRPEEHKGDSSSQGVSRLGQVATPVPDERGAPEDHSPPPTNKRKFGFRLGGRSPAAKPATREAAPAAGVPQAAQQREGAGASSGVGHNSVVLPSGRQVRRGCVPMRRLLRLFMKKKTISSAGQRTGGNVLG